MKGIIIEDEMPDVHTCNVHLLVMNKHRCDSGKCFRPLIQADPFISFPGKKRKSNEKGRVREIKCKNERKTERWKELRRRRRRTTRKTKRNGNRKSVRGKDE